MNLKVISRRAFLSSLSLLAASFAAPIGCSADVFPEIIRAILRKRCAPLDLVEEDLLSFSIEYADKTKDISANDPRLFTFYPLLPLYRASDILNHTPLADFIYYREMEIVSTFLLSTDFFRKNKVDPSKLTYLRYYEPADLFCVNPFAPLS